MNRYEQGKRLLQIADRQLRRGIKHYDKQHKMLETPSEIMTCMLSEGEVTLDPIPKISLQMAGGPVQGPLKNYGEALCFFAT